MCTLDGMTFDDLFHDVEWEWTDSRWMLEEIDSKMKKAKHRMKENPIRSHPDYNKIVGEVYLTFLSQDGAFKVRIMQDVQNRLKNMFGLNLHKETWKNKTNLVDWFCENWSKIKYTVPSVIKAAIENDKCNKVTKTDVQETKGKTRQIFEATFWNSFLNFEALM